MIDVTEISARARTLGIDPAYVERDHLLSHVLAAIAEGEPHLTFRGGTALARVYWPDFRLSEDLDFIGDITARELERTLSRAVESAAQQSSMDLELRFGAPKGGWSRSSVRAGEIEILVDVNAGDRPYLPAEEHPLRLPYSDLGNRERKIRVLALAEILGNKWFMLDDDDRREPRDLYDVWTGLVRFGVPFEELARGHHAKYGTNPSEGQLRRAERLKELWETRLGHQLADLPPFDDVLAAVRHHFEGWRAQEV